MRCSRRRSSGRSRDFSNILHRHQIEARSVARKLSCLRGFYKWLLLDKRIRHDPTVNIESPKAWKVLPKALAEKGDRRDAGCGNG